MWTSRQFYGCLWFEHIAKQKKNGDFFMASLVEFVENKFPGKSMF
jgi:hypothetical protein